MAIQTDLACFMVQPGGIQLAENAGTHRFGVAAFEPIVILVLVTGAAIFRQKGTFEVGKVFGWGTLERNGEFPVPVKKGGIGGHPRKGDNRPPPNTEKYRSYFLQGLQGLHGFFIFFPHGLQGLHGLQGCSLGL
jgi:hypothetical protein